jgi:hypothetical protein
MDPAGHFEIFSECVASEYNIGTEAAPSSVKSEDFHSLGDSTGKVSASSNDNLGQSLDKSSDGSLTSKLIDKRYHKIAHRIGIQALSTFDELVPETGPEVAFLSAIHELPGTVKDAVTSVITMKVMDRDGDMRSIVGDIESQIQERHIPNLGANALARDYADLGPGSAEILKSFVKMSAIGHDISQAVTCVRRATGGLVVDLLLKKLESALGVPITLDTLGRLNDWHSVWRTYDSPCVALIRASEHYSWFISQGPSMEHVHWPQGGILYHNPGFRKTRVVSLVSRMINEMNGGSVSVHILITSRRFAIDHSSLLERYPYGTTIKFAARTFFEKIPCIVSVVNNGHPELMATVINTVYQMAEESGGTWDSEPVARNYLNEWGAYEN